MTSRFLAILLTLAPTLALAAEGHHAEHHGVPWGTLLFSTINVLIFFWVLKRFAWPMLASWVKERRADVVKALEDAAQAKQDADRLKTEWEQRIANLAQETEAMRRQSRAEMERERDQILAAAQRTAAAIREDARRLADHEVRQAQAKLRDEVAKQAFEIARKMTAERVTDADQARFVDEFVDRVNA